jgi:hypothetical protein
MTFSCPGEVMPVMEGILKIAPLYNTYLLISLCDHTKGEMLPLGETQVSEVCLGNLSTSAHVQRL